MDKTKNKKMSQTTDFIYKILVDKGTLKQKVFDNTQQTLKLIKQVSKELETELNEKLETIKDARINLKFRSTGIFQAELKVAGDLLVFFMHSNIFRFPEKSKIWKTDYLKENPANGYVGIIRIYNFLADSFKYRRTDDLGLLLSRIFVDQNNNFWLEQLAEDFKSFYMVEPQPVTKDVIKQILEQNILFALNFDAEVLDYDTVKLTTVNEIIEARKIGAPTGKKVGFKLQESSNSQDNTPQYTGI